MKVAQPYFNKGNSTIVKKDYAETFLRFDKEIKLNPKIARAYLGRGILKNSTHLQESSTFDFSKTPVIDHFKTKAPRKITITLNYG